MEKTYYIVQNETRVGPLTYQQLAERGLSPSTLVWTAGMSDWVRADSLAELQPILAATVINEESAFGAYAQQEPPEISSGERARRRFEAGGNSFRNDDNGRMEVRTNWKTLAIISMIAGFLFSCIGGIVGIFALLEANKAEKAGMEGFDNQARSYWSNCKTLTIISMVLTGIGLVTNVAFILKAPTFLSLYGL